MSDVEIGQSMLAADRIICAPRKVNLQARRERVTTVMRAPYRRLSRWSQRFLVVPTERGMD